MDDRAYRGVFIREWINSRDCCSEWNRIRHIFCGFNAVIDYNETFVEQQPGTEAPPKPGFDDSSIKVGAKLFHKAFGHGVVEALGNGRLTVAFCDIIKPILFPASFLQGFLKVDE